MKGMQRRYKVRVIIELPDKKDNKEYTPDIINNAISEGITIGKYDILIHINTKKKQDEIFNVLRESKMVL